MMTSILRATPVVIAGVVLAACGGSEQGEDGQPSPLGTVSTGTAVAAVESFDPAGEDAIAALNEIAFAGGDFVPDLAPLFQDEDADPNQRWAALYLIALGTDTDEEIAVLTPVLDDDERRVVGTEYKQVSTFDARKRGAAMDCE